MALFAGIDLHGRNGYYGILDENGKRVFGKRLPNDLGVILPTLEPFREDLEGVAVESTYNWYWLVDGLQDAQYEVHLANPGAMDQYDGLKDVNDQTDAFWIAEMLRLGILPEGYIYPRDERPVRDLLRRRMMLVQQRTSHLLSFQSLLTRETGQGLCSNEIKKLEETAVASLLHEECQILAGETNLALVRFLTERIVRIEKVLVAEVELRPEYEGLLTVPGIGRILGLTIMLETGPIGRFSKVGNYTSYCRGVKVQRTSNGKKKSGKKNNRKNGNRYLAWAYVEGAHFLRRYCPEANSWYQRKLAKTGKEVVAIKALASKLSKACYFILRDQVSFDVRRIFG